MGRPKQAVKFCKCKLNFLQGYADMVETVKALKKSDWRKEQFEEDIQSLKDVIITDVLSQLGIKGQVKEIPTKALVNYLN